MFAKMCALRNKKGFTLAELLIVVAIIAILVAVAVPVFMSSRDAAEQAVIQANCRSVLAEATVDYLTDGNLDEDEYTYGGVTFTASAVGDVVTVTGGSYTCSTTNPTPSK